MPDIWDEIGVYQREFDDDTALARMGGTSKQQAKESRQPRLPKPGQPAIHDHEYERNGAANLFMAYAPFLGKRHVKASGRRVRTDFAFFMRDIADIHFPNKKIVLVMDNLNTHHLSSLYKAFQPVEAERIAGRFEVHYTPRHGSWLNMAEIEIGVLMGQCLKGRIADRETMRRKVAAWVTWRNKQERKVNWRFTTRDARIKLKKLYPSIG